MNLSTGAFERRELLALEQEVLKVPEGELVARRLFPIETGINPGAETYGYTYMTRMGSAKIIANGDTNLPMVDTDFKRDYRALHSIGAGAEYTRQEMRAAAMANRSVDADKISAARRAVSEFEDKLIFRGNEAYGITGAINTPGILTTAFDDNLKNMTSNEILDAFRDARAQLTTQIGFSSANLTLVLPQRQYEYLVGTRYGDLDARTLMEIIKSYNWFTAIVPTDALKGAGDGNTDTAIIFNNSKDVSKILLALDITMLPQETYAMYTKLGLEERTGGLLIKQPTQFLRIDNI